METPSLSVPIDSVRRLGRLAPLTGMLAAGYIALAGLCVYAGIWDYHNSAERQPNRLPYLAIMYTSFILLFILSFLRTAQATVLLHRLRSEPTAAGFDNALAKVRDILLLFFSWLTLAAVGFIWAIFLPAY